MRIETPDPWPSTLSSWYDDLIKDIDSGEIKDSVLVINRESGCYFDSNDKLKHTEECTCDKDD